jgi:hypothetical protein
VVDFHVDSIEIHSNQIWKDLMEFYNSIGVFEKILKINKDGHLISYKVNPGMHQM